MNQLVTGKFIALKRKQKNLTQEQLAEKLGVSNKTISKWETGKCMPDYSIVKSLCEELEVTVAELMDGEISEENSVRTYDDEQILDLLRRTQELEKQKNMLYGIINCNVAIARDQFITVKEQYQKTEGIQAYHGYLSFKETDISPEMAQKIGMEFANEVWGKRFQVVVTTHLNTKHLHCHFVINSISFVDGKHLWGEEKAWFKFRKVADRICEKYGLYYDPNPNRSKQSDYLTMKEKAGICAGKL